jgi:hypothetical protein
LAFGVRHSYGSNGHEFNVINLLCSYSPRLLLLRPKTTTLTLQLTTQNQPKWQSNSRQPATRRNASSSPSSIPSPTNTTPPPHYRRQGRQGKAGSRSMARNTASHAQEHSYTASFRSVSFHSILPTPHHTTPHPAPPHLTCPRPAESSHSHTLPLPFPSPFPRLDSLPHSGIASRPVHAWPASVPLLQTADGEARGARGYAYPRARAAAGLGCWCCWWCG